MYGKIVNNVIAYAPKNYIGGDGVIIFNFNANEELLKNHGFKMIIDLKPEYDINTHYIVDDGYEETDECIFKKYRCNAIIVNEVDPDHILYEIEQLTEEIYRLKSMLENSINEEGDE